MQIYEEGKVAVVGFGGGQMRLRIDFSQYRSLLTELTQRDECRVLVLDLAGVKYVPSNLLSVLISIRKLVDRIEIHNPTDSAKETLVKIQMGDLFEICEPVA